MRTRMLAGLAIVAGAMTGCWSTPPGRPPIGGANNHVPRTNTNGFPPAGNAANGMNPSPINQPPANNAATPGGLPVSRTTGMPANDGRSINLTSGPAASTPNTTDGPGYFKQQPAVGPIANNANAALNRGAAQPATGAANDPLPPPDKLPLVDNGTLPGVQPNLTAAQDPKPQFRRTSPVIPAETTLQPISPPPPTRVRAGDPTPILAPPQ